jgi:hypothetical protein
MLWGRGIFNFLNDLLHNVQKVEGLPDAAKLPSYDVRSSE